MFDISLSRLKPESRADKYVLENIGASKASTMLASGSNAYVDSPSISKIFDINY